MAKRPIFTPSPSLPYVQICDTEFTWYSGFARSQKEKSILSLHEAGKNMGIHNILEISSYSAHPLGKSLSAFYLPVQYADFPSMTVESLFQSAKVFENAGPFPEFHTQKGWEIKKDTRLRTSGALLSFRLGNEEWPLEPKTIFYDWIYLHALQQNPVYAEQLLNFEGFTDIAFHPEKSFSCQARSAALFVALSQQELLTHALKGKREFLSLFEDNIPNEQLSLF